MFFRIIVYKYTIMSRNRLKNSWKRKQVYGQVAYMHDAGRRNPSCLDEMPKTRTECEWRAKLALAFPSHSEADEVNRPSRFVAAHCPNDIRWLQEPGYCQGHKTRRGAHRMVNGIIRASLKEELRKQILPIDSTGIGPSVIGMYSEDEQ